MAVKLEQRIDDFYKLGKQFAALSLFCFLPAIAVIAMPVGWVFAVRRKQLLADAARLGGKFDARSVEPDGLTRRDKLTAIQGWTIRFFVPTALALVECAIGVILYRRGVFDGML